MPHQVVGAQLSPETEEEGGTGTGDVHKMNPWGYLVYKNTQNINMINFIGSVSSDSTRFVCCCRVAVF
jgi:hypothetical protein